MAEEATTTAATETGEAATATVEKTEPDTITMSKAEVDALKRTVAEARKAERKAEVTAQKAAEEEAKRKGDYEAAAKAAEERAAQAEQRAQQVERSNRVTAAAARLKFRDPGDVMHFLKEDVLDDDGQLEQALKALKKNKPYLAEDEQRRSGGQIDPARAAGNDMDSLIRRAAGRA